ncbi:condensation domain-containing protein [Pseudomonas hefeiensis]|nr:condensation domain-containing protein [Pseudomonas sp. FP53]WLH94187.1 condensation domain-containing protein [Pseudomonas sp. FP53]
MLFEAPTLAAFTAAVSNQQQAGAEAQGVISPLPRHEALPQSLAQNRLWITWQLDPASRAYTIPGALHLRGELDEDALRASFQQLLERHEALRTTISGARWCRAATDRSGR